MTEARLSGVLGKAKNRASGVLTACPMTATVLAAHQPRGSRFAIRFTTPVNKGPLAEHSDGGQPDPAHRPTTGNPPPVFGQRARRGGVHDLCRQRFSEWVDSASPSCEWTLAHREVRTPRVLRPSVDFTSACNGGRLNCGGGGGLRALGRRPSRARWAGSPAHCSAACALSPLHRRWASGEGVRRGVGSSPRSDVLPFSRAPIRCNTSDRLPSPG